MEFVPVFSWEDKVKELAGGFGEELERRGGRGWKNTPREVMAEPPSALDIGSLPTNSWVLSVPVQLTKPAFSREETILSEVENPTRREKSTRIPCIAGPSWKGALRHALRRLLEHDPDPVSVKDAACLFGSDVAGGAGGGPRRGRLIFSASYFSEREEYVTSKMDEERRTGKTPIRYSVVKASASGKFELGYCTWFDDVAGDESLRHAKLSARAVAVMFRQSGFGGKASSGFGAAEVDGEAVLRRAGKAKDLLFKSFKEMGSGW